LPPAPLLIFFPDGDNETLADFFDGGDVAATAP
jgi:hypothetical protein